MNQLRQEKFDLALGMIGDIPPLSYTGRAKNLVLNILSKYMILKFLQSIEEVVRPIVRPDFNAEEQLGKSAFVLVNVDEHVDFNRPISHKVVYIGGFGQMNPKPLEPKYEQILNSSKNGVVLISFGSVAQSYLMPQEMKKKFLEAFAEFPDVTFLWKYEKDEDNVAAGYKNVITGKWLPQTDLLVHPKLLAFISHGGANSIAEATVTGVPIICIPLFADQPRNSFVVKYRKVGVNLNKKEVMEGKLVDALHQVLDDDRVIERPVDFEITASMADMQGDIWAVKDQDFGDMQKMVKILSTAHSTLCKRMIGDVPPLSYTGRAKNLLMNVLSQYLMAKAFLQPIEEVVRPIVRPDFIVEEQLVKSAFILVNTDEHVDFNRPISHKVVYIGGFGQTNPKPLEPKYEQIMNSSKKGVVLVSFGSVAQSYLMPQEMKKKFLEAFAEFPDVTFLWKYEKDEDNVAAGYENVITGKWLPQTDLLVHPKLLAFISHGGANSIAEATATGVPIICIPLFADQPRNGLVVKYRKVGVNLNKKEVMEGKLADALHQVLDDDSYRKNSKRLASMIKAKPMTADERLTKYVEFAAKFGNDNNLDMHGRHLNFFEFYCLDIIIPFFVIALWK
uniref:glucuronosyltransferase n=1 Tax=Acrobeloides nanus TaxID=290746 RepID=A0A914CE27_9BILA